MAQWTLADMPNSLEGKTYIVTGTSSGIGTVMAYELAKRGAVVIGANRNVPKSIDAIKASHPNNEMLASFKPLELDVSSIASVKQFSEKIMSDNTIHHIDGLILNAGIMGIPERRLSVDGLEMQMATNVVGHHLLTSLLMKKLLAAPQSIVISTSSGASNQIKHKATWDDLNSEKSYDPWEVYSMTKIAACQFRDGLLERMKEADLSSSVHVIATHPGVTSTPLFDEAKGAIGMLFRFFRSTIMMKSEQGALSSLKALVDETVPNGGFVGPGGMAGMFGNPKVVDTFNPKFTLDPRLRAKLWDYCDNVTGATWFK
jgi:NAD(P)-dependent dehydrogenase (short-subunit alcohol dehydrogenase family)